MDQNGGSEASSPGGSTAEIKHLRLEQIKNKSAIGEVKDLKMPRNASQPAFSSYVQNKWVKIFFLFRLLKAKSLHFYKLKNLLKSLILTI